jgi:dodecin
MRVLAWCFGICVTGGADSDRHKVFHTANARVRTSLTDGIVSLIHKVIDVVGTSKESFAKAAENAVAEAAKTVRGMKWARVAELEMALDGKKIVQYRTTAKIYFDIEK